MSSRGSGMSTGIIAYRREIDGLRALAVLAVILLHAGIPGFYGGFVGVDIFLVISGYLITTIILTSVERGSFSLVEFYERRARRILPALFLVLLVSLPFAWRLLFPGEMESFAKSLVAVATFTSNIFFWQETDYWSSDASLIPLLHTWSLGVEEQFYLIFPVVLIILWRWGRSWIPFVCAAVVGGGLVLSQVAVEEFPVAGFYLLPTRAWELGIGVLVALYMMKRGPHPSEVPALLGLALVVFSVAAFDSSVPFPSLHAIAPTAGAALIILSGTQSTVTGRLLGSRLLVGIGLISYSAYLWHQPVFAFARLSGSGNLDAWTTAVLIALIFPLSYLSWRFVERPFRHKKEAARKRKGVLLTAAAGSLVFVGIGLGIAMAGGVSERPMGDRQQPLAERVRSSEDRSLTLDCRPRMPLPPECSTSRSPEVAVWGDSFARHLVEGIIASEPKVALSKVTKSSCAPFFGVAAVWLPGHPEREARECIKFNSGFRDWLKEHPSVRSVVISSSFEPMFDGRRLIDAGGSTRPSGVKSAVAEFERTLSELESIGVTPVIVSPVPQNGTNIWRCLARARYRGDDLDVCNFPLADARQASRQVDDFLKRLSARHKIIRMNALMCPNGACKSHIGNVFLYRDGSHLSVEGAQALGKSVGFYSIIRGAGGRSQ